MIIHHKFVLACLAVISLAGAPAAFAGTIVYFDEYRSVSADGTGASSTDAGHFNELYAVASPRFGIGASAFQDSLIDASFVGGIGEVNAGAPQGPVVAAASTLFTAFVLDQDYWAILAVDLFAAGSGTAFASLVNTDTNQDLLLQSAFNETEIAAFSGILTAGRYAISLGADTSGQFTEGQPYSAFATFSGGLTLAPLDAAPVPEPASMTMLALGLLGAGARRFARTRKSTSPPQP